MSGPTRSSHAVASSSTQIDLCRGPYNVRAGDDITTPLQNAINTLAAIGKGGEITFSAPGTYLINGAQQTGTAFGYTYSGQILFPATADRSHEFCIRIKGGVRANSSNNADNSGYNGVVLQSNATSGNVFDCVPGFTAFAGSVYGWTGIQPAFEDLVLVCPSNPQCGGIKALVAFRFYCRNLTITTPNAALAQTGSAVALWLPQGNNSGDTSVDAQIVGFPVGVDMSEHAVFERIYIGRCTVAFRSSVSSGHANTLKQADVEECVTVFQAINPGGMVLSGLLDGENVVSDSFAQGALVDEWTSGRVKGRITFSPGGGWHGGFPLGSKYSGIALDIVRADLDGNSGWKSCHPRDDFTRVGAVSGAGPGTSWPTMHPWRLAAGACTVSGNVLSNTGNSAGLLPVLDGAGGGRARAITVAFTLGSTSPWIEVIGQAVYNGVNNALQSTSIKARVQSGSLKIAVNGTDRVTGLGTFSASTAYTVTLALLYNTLGRVALVKAYQGTTLLGSYALTAAEQALFVAGNTYPYIEDGVYLLNSGTTVSSFAVRPISQDAAALLAASATLVAGTVTVANAAITASSIVKVWNVKSGGTVGALSVTLTAGTGFTINSTSNTDTSTVYYEIVSY